MGLDYWLVHFTWTIPPAALLTVAYWPFFTRTEILKIFTLITIAVIATIPWDSYLIRNRIWTYPDDAVVGVTIFKIPIEEVFFFIIQTYLTGLLYMILHKRLVLPVYLLPKFINSSMNFVPLVLSGGIAAAAACIWVGNELTYMGLIMGWALPVIAFQWFFGGSFLLALPKKPILISILLPTVYLWMVDFLSLQRGTWVIEPGTKLDLQFGGYLDVEEALFFLMTNVMVVLGFVTMDHAIAIAEYEDAIAAPGHNKSQSFQQVVWNYMTRRQRSLDLGFLEGLSIAIDRLAEKSQSMYLGSAMFQGRLRIDLILLYSFCRVIDDLVDEAPDKETAKANIKEASQVLYWHFSNKNLGKPLYEYLDAEYGAFQKKRLSPLISSIALLPTSRLTIKPLLELLRGFEMDLGFCAEKNEFPITSESDLDLYAYRVAGTVASSLLELIFGHFTTATSEEDRSRIIEAGQNMGQALQCVNIARDIKRDAAIARVYIPTFWLENEGLRPRDVIANPDDSKLAVLEERMIKKAEGLHDLNVAAIAQLPIEARGPVKTTVESYMMIGKMVRKRRQGALSKTNGKLRVPLWRRLSRAWWDMCSA